MKTRKRFSIIFVALVLVLGLTTSAMASVGIAWEGFDMTGTQHHSQIHYWDGSTTRQISDYWNQNMYPSLDNGQIAWQGGTYFSWYLYYWDGSTIRQITDQPGGSTFPSPPSLHNAQIAWRGANGIYFWDGSTITNIISGSGINPGDPSLHNGQIAWYGCDFNGNEWGIYYWDGSIIRQVCGVGTYPGYYKYPPSLHNGQIAWSRFDGWGGMRSITGMEAQ